MRKPSTLLALATLGLLLPAALHAQTLPTQSAYKRAADTRALWAGNGFSAEDFRLTDAYTEASGLEHVYVQQVHRGIPVYNRVLSLAFVRGRLAHHAGSFVPAKPLAALPATPVVSAAGAVARAVRHLLPAGGAEPALLRNEGGPEARQYFAPTGVAKRDIVASLAWVLDPAGRPHLAWNVNVDVLNSPDWWNVQVDAASGTIIGQDNWTVEEKAHDDAQHHAAAAPTAAVPAVAAAVARHPYAAAYLPAATTTASYFVVPYPRLNPNSTGGLQTVTDPWLNAGAGNNATTHGWHYDGTTDYAFTRGNNVSAYDDAARLNAPGNYAPSTTTGTTLTFGYTPDFAQAPSVVLNRNAAVTNLFYWNNITHDVLYQYGFTEAAGNFQKDNIGRGGNGNDHVLAEAQDGNGTNNANFNTPPDGSSGRMQMYLWSAAPAPITVTAPSVIAGSYQSRESNFSTANKLANLGPISGQVGLYVDAGSSPATNIACVAHSGPSLTGKIALITRGGACGFPAKVKNAQLAGAIAAIVINNVAGAPIVMGGTDNTITIPAVMISQADGALITARASDGVQVTLNRPGPQLDGDFDSGIMVHEYGHGVSNRLTGGPSNASCLGNAEQGGEGWSDYLALMLNTDWTAATINDGPRAITVGTYAAGQANTGAGIRRFPYSTSLSVNPLTYADVATNPEVHAIGEIWTAVLWDMTWNVIQQQGSLTGNFYNSAGTGGNVAALQLVMQGMKLQPCMPGFLDARDAILSADSLLYGGQYHCSIWRAFARRGMGYSAVQGSSNSATDQIAAYDMPPPVTLQKTTALMAGNTFDVALQLNCNCTVPTAAYTLTDQLPTGLQYVSSTPAATVSGNTVTFSNIQFTAPGQVKTFHLRAQSQASAGCTPALPVNDDRDGNTLGGFASTALSGTAGWTSSTTMASSPTRSWWGTAPTTPTDYVLTSTPFTPTGLSSLTFNHFYNFEGSYDGGSVELSADNGVTWTNAAPYFIENGPNSTFDASTTGTSGVPCFTGRSVTGTSTAFIRSVMNLTSFSGQALRVRFRVRTDQGSPSAFEGWYVDDIKVSNGCGGTQLIELRDGSSALAGSASIMTYLLPTTTTAQQGALAQALQFAALPNPFGSTGLHLTLTVPATLNEVTFSLYDVAGRLLLSRPADHLSAGPNTISWSEAAKLPAGLYLVRAQLPDGSATVLRVVKE
ncbi:M36 family metallopeptidase [Hymenobacter sp. 15J16-1T3B]|uniref:M36 family metallopeptidase n=1 Tax=Hymenobacter sp. 15J16-1T3B TaxID=2886941 RepID=UPI001D12F06D|nr:M36 family metallopeptidase [Hymenobacter sp. 15J16-1T3B]MCC3157383.1 M36 family metallopeptidase [Hymenobacter sp. 15J16-1T3B]